MEGSEVFHSVGRAIFIPAQYLEDLCGTQTIPTVTLELIFHMNMEVRILTSFGAGDLGTEVDFLYAMMWVTKVTF